MASKTVMVEMDEQLANWLSMLPDVSVQKFRVIGEFIATPTPNKPVRNGDKIVHNKQEFPRGTRVKCQHRPPEDAPTRRAAWDYLKDKFGDMTIAASDARQSLMAAGVKGGSVLVTNMMRQRELKPVTD